jgi:hypothetical protein
MALGRESKVFRTLDEHESRVECAYITIHHPRGEFLVEQYY